MPRRRHLAAVPDADPSSALAPVAGPWFAAVNGKPSDAPGPRLPSFLVDRPRLLEALEHDSPLTIVRAPLGYGKTTLLAQWLRARRPAARETALWIRISEDASAGQSFWREVADTLESAGIPVTARRNAPDTPRAQVRRALATIRHPTILVFDEFERVTEGSLDNALLEMLRDTPMLRLVISLRSWQHFRPMQYVDIDTTTIEATDLLFRAEETAALFEEAGIGASPSLAARIHREVHGRPEPARAIALGLRNSGQIPDGDIAAQVAADYTRDKLLPAVGGRDVFEFVLGISLVDPVPLELADIFVKETTNDGLRSLPLLERLERQGFLQRSSDGVAPTFHWPQLSGREALTSWLGRRDPERAQALRAVAARWYAENDEPGLALELATTAERWPLVVEIIESDWRPLLLSHRDQLLKTFSEAPAAAIEASAVSSAVRGLRLQIPDELWLANIQKLPSDPDQVAELARSPEIANTLDLALISLLGLRQRGMFAHALAYAHRLEAVAVTAVQNRSSEAVTGLPGLLLQIGIVQMLADGLQRAPETLLRAYDNASAHRPSHVPRDAAGKLALVSALSGGIPEAQTWLERYFAAPDTGERYGWGGSRVTLTAAVAQAILALDRLDLPAAHEALTEARAHAVDMDEFWAFYLYAQILYRVHDDRPEQALAMLEVGRSHHAALAKPGSTAGPLLAALEADLLLALGRANLADALFRTTTTNHPLLQISSARLALLSEDAEQAASLTTSHNLTRVATTRMVIEIQVINATAQHRLGRAEAAASSLRKAIATAAPLGLIRPFTTVPVADLEAIAADVTEAPDFLAQPALEGAHRPFTDTLALVQLTERELLILSKLTDGTSIQEIGGELFLSRNTIKTHVRNLYRKLGASSREEAITRGHALGLL